MNKDRIIRLGSFLVLLLAQAFILNHIHLFGLATPLLYVYFVLSFRRNTPKWAILLWSFILGLCIDVFSDTPGVAASSLTLIAFVQPYLLSMFVSRESADDMVPSFTTLGISKYFSYSAILTLIYCVVFFAVETFNFFDWFQWLGCVGGSFAVTLLIIWALEYVVRRK